MSKIIRLTENQFGEMMAYHGSGSDFDKFNHKKYLGKGAGSQTFGWGTYVTDDVAIANDYSKIPGDCTEQIKPLVEKAMKLYGGNEYFSVDDVCTDINSTIQTYRGNFKHIIDVYEHQLKKPSFSGQSMHIFYKIILYVVKRMTNIPSCLYEVDIPDDDGFNYISWYDDLTNEQLDIIHSKIDKFSKRYNKVDFNNFTEYSQGFARPNGGNSIYASLEYAFYIAGIDKQNSAKAASLFLMQCGFDGIKYPAGTRWQKPDGASENAMNYVIFDSNKVKIVNKTKV